jgi:chromosome partitioning protein
MMKKVSRIIAVANEKGGVGKTVTAINLAAALSLKGKRVLVVDMDPQGNATRGLGVGMDDNQATAYDMLCQPQSVVAGDVVVKTKWKGLDLIPSHVDLAGAEVELVAVAGRENRLKQAIEPIRESYDVMILDTPPSLSLLTVNVFACAGSVIVPCQTHPYAFDALAELFDTIGAVQQEINPDLTVAGILATMFDRRTRVSHNTLNRLREDVHTKDFMFRTVIRSNTTIADSAEVGKPVVFYRSTSFGALDYKMFADELLDGER